jgi:hypothetical protein
LSWKVDARGHKIRVKMPTFSLIILNVFCPKMHQIFVCIHSLFDGEEIKELKLFEKSNIWKVARG